MAIDCRPHSNQGPTMSDRKETIAKLMYLHQSRQNAAAIHVMIISIAAQMFVMCGPITLILLQSTL